MLTGKLMGAGAVGGPPIEYIGNDFALAQEGDIVIAGLESIQAWDGNLYIPSGWTIISYALSPIYWYSPYKERIATCYRIIQSGDASPTVSPWGAYCAVYRPSKTISSVQSAGIDGGTNNNTAYINCASDASGCDALIAFESFHAWTMTSGRSYSFSMDQAGSFGAKFIISTACFIPDDAQNITCSGGAKTSPGYTTYFLRNSGYLRLFY